MDAVWTFAALVLVSVVSAVVGPLVMLRATAAQKTRERAEEIAARELERLQDIAARDQVRVQVEEAARLLKEQDRKIEVGARETANKLDVIHTLVDGQMTAAMQSEFDMAQANLVLLKEAAARSGQAGELAALTEAAIKVMEEKVAKLGAALKDRKEKIAIAEEQIRQQGRER